MGDLFDDLYAPRAVRYGDDMAPEDVGDSLPDRHGWRYHLATGCRCAVCVAGCHKVQGDGRTRAKARPWETGADAEPALTSEQWKAARSA